MSPRKINTNNNNKVKRSRGPNN